MQQVNRLEPALPPHARKSYTILSPPDTEVVAACQEVGCVDYRRGWRTVVDETTELGAKQAHYIRRESKRTFVEGKTDAGLTVFTFASHQRCFREHRTRPTQYLVREGDHRGNPRGAAPIKHQSPEDWVEDFAAHQQTLADRLARG